MACTNSPVESVINTCNYNYETNWLLGSAPPQRPMGLGILGSGGIVFKRKFRWTMCLAYCLSGTEQSVPEQFVKIGARPQLDIEETEINYLHGKMFIPGKATWQEMQVTWYDVAGTTDDSTITAGIFGWIASIYDFVCDPTNLYMGSHLNDYEGRALLYLYDGCGQAVEGWLLQHVWPKAVDFGDLDMNQSEECTIQMTLRYTSVEYQSYCPDATITKCECTPCGE